MARVVKRDTTLKRQALMAGAAAAASWGGVGLAWWLVSRTHPHDLKGLVLLLIPIALLIVAKQVTDFLLIYVRGYRAERSVLRRLQRLADDYLVFNDVHLSAGGRTAQIDHILVSPYGLWCVETKSWLGTIRGKERDRTWTQIKKSDRGKRHTRTFQNPVSQNATHCRMLRQHLNQSLNLLAPVRSVIVFTAAELRVDTTTPVIRPGELTRVIEASDTQACLSTEDLQRVVASLSATGLRS